MLKLLTVERGNCAKENVYTYLEFFTYFTVRTTFTGKSFSEALILASTNPQYDKRLFIDLPV